MLLGRFSYVRTRFCVGFCDSWGEIGLIVVKAYLFLRGQGQLGGIRAYPNLRESGWA